MSYYPEKVPRQISWTSQGRCYGLLEDNARLHPENPATSFFGATMTYRGTRPEANRFAHALDGLGVEPGDRVAIHLPKLATAADQPLWRPEGRRRRHHGQPPLRTP